MEYVKYIIFVGKPLRKFKLGKPGRSWDVNIETNAREGSLKGWEERKWLRIVSNDERWRMLN
jgi:hypothetical protein